MHYKTIYNITFSLEKHILGVQLLPLVTLNWTIFEEIASLQMVLFLKTCTGLLRLCYGIFQSQKSKLLQFVCEYPCSFHGNSFRGINSNILRGDSPPLSNLSQNLPNLSQKFIEPSKWISNPVGDICRHFTKLSESYVCTLHSNPIPPTDDTNGLL